jgi:hypothetical protein
MPTVRYQPATFANLSKGYTCDANKQMKIVFEGSFIKVIRGSETLYSLDMSGFGQFGSDFGGSFKKSYYIPAGGNYMLYGGNVAQAQGEVSMIVIRARYDSSIPAENQYITIDYKGEIFPCRNLMFLTGATKDDIPWAGWDLDETVASPDLDLGGMLISNPTSGEVEIQILVMN